MEVTAAPGDGQGSLMVCVYAAAAAWDRVRWYSAGSRISKTAWPVARTPRAGADKRAVFAEILRVLRPGGRLQFADIANGRPVPAEALRDIDLWTG